MQYGVVHGVWLWWPQPVCSKWNHMDCLGLTSTLSSLPFSSLHFPKKLLHHASLFRTPRLPWDHLHWCVSVKIFGEQTWQSSCQHAQRRSFLPLSEVKLSWTGEASLNHFILQIRIKTMSDHLHCCASSPPHILNRLLNRSFYVTFYATNPPSTKKNDH